MRSNTPHGRLWLGAGIAAAAAVVATGAFGVTAGGTITTIAGNGVQGFSGDGGAATSAQLRSARGVAVDEHGNVYIADYENRRVRKVSTGGTITTFAGTGGGTGGGAYLGDGGPATSAGLNGPLGVAVDGQGNVYISDYNDYRVRKVSAGGTITTFAGTGIPGFSGDGGPATSARLHAPYGVAVDGQGNVYIVDSYNQRVRKVSPGGTITTIAGTGKQGFSGDGGPATSATMTYPQGVAADGQGNVYFADGNRVRKVNRSGTITTFAGTGAGGFAGDGGPATSALVRTPYWVAVDGQGNVYLSEFASHRVRKVSPGGTITTFAGTGAGGFAGDGGPATSARLYGPYGVAADGQGNVYIADSYNQRVRKVAKPTAAATLTLTLGGAPTQPLLAQKGIAITARGDTPCALSATGTVVILGTRYTFALTRASARLTAGTRTLTLRFPTAAQRRFRRLLKSGQRARATITVKATDKAGRTVISKRTVTVQT